jgi:hypothetical protein
MCTFFDDDPDGITRRTNKIRSRVFWESQANSENNLGPFITSPLVFGSGLISTILLITDNFSTFNAIFVMTAGIVLVAIPAIYSIYDSLYTIGTGIIQNKNQLFRTCDILQLSQAFFAIFSDPLKSLVDALLQTLYLLANLLLMVPLLCLNLEKAEDRFNKVGNSYLDVFAHITSACTSVFFNVPDFLGCVGVSLVSGCAAHVDTVDIVETETTQAMSI